jgi:alkylhydroperoxidase family enzyme
VSEADREALRAVGFSDAEIFDITDVAAFFNYTNRMAHGLDMVPNREYHAMNR